MPFLALPLLDKLLVLAAASVALAAATFFLGRWSVRRTVKSDETIESVPADASTTSELARHRLMILDALYRRVVSCESALKELGSDGEAGAEALREACAALLDALTRRRPWLSSGTVDRADGLVAVCEKPQVDGVLNAVGKLRRNLDTEFRSLYSSAKTL